MTTRRVSGSVAAIVLVVTALMAGAVGFAASVMVRHNTVAPPTASIPTATAQVSAPTVVPATPTPLGSGFAPPLLTTATPGVASATTAPSPTATAAPFDAEQLYAAVSPAVVTISNKQKSSPNARTSTQANAGSGTIYDARGYILTNRHVIDGAEAIEITLQSGRIVAGTLVGQDAVADLAVVKIDPADVPAVATFGDSAAIRSGQRVVVIGSPHEFDGSISRGIISGTDRSFGGTDGLIQTDAAISPGNSGGPLVNARGEVIGIATSTLRPNIDEKIGFAIPSNLAKRLADVMVADGKVTRPYLGVTTQLLTPAIADELGAKATHGAYLAAVSPNTPAAQAGLTKGDVITALNGAPVDQKHPLNVVLLDVKPGDTVTVTVNHDGTERPISVTLVERPASLDP